jgi:hypothetical protein
MSFLRHGEIYRSDVVLGSDRPEGVRRLPLVGAPAPVKDATEGARLAHRPR